MTETPSTKTVGVFAVGCFHFVSDAFGPDEDWENYARGIETCLAHVDNISNIDVNISDGFKLFSFNPASDNKGRNEEFNPCPNSGIISFDLFLPTRVQEQVFHGSNAGIERFRVEITYDDEFPVTFISPIGDLEDIENGFSDAVPIVREFMLSKCGKSDGVRFVCMGPSPFHAEFYLKMSEGEEKIEIKRSLGYDDIVYTTHYGMDEDLHEFKLRVSQVLSYFYFAIYSRNAARNLEFNINVTIRDVLGRLTERNPLASAWNSIYHSNRRDIALVYSDLFDLEDALNGIKSSIEDDKRRLDEDDTSSPLWYYVQRELNDFPHNARENIAHLLRLSEVFETSRANNWTIVAAALVSAVITCLATLGAVVLTHPACANASGNQSNNLAGATDLPASRATGNALFKH